MSKNSIIDNQVEMHQPSFIVIRTENISEYQIESFRKMWLKEICKPLTTPIIKGTEYISI
jgi:hypothetical protein